jgi:plasmid stability protein
MALIQIRDVPDDVYEELRRRARRDGQSMQKYLLARLIEMGRRPDKSELFARIERDLARRPPLVIDTDELLADIRSGRE